MPAPPFTSADLRISPSGPFLPPTGGGGLVRWGYDQVVKGSEVAIADPDPLPFPRDADDPPNPMRVILPGVTPGNFLRVAWELTIQNTDDVSNFVLVQTVVTFDGTTAFPGTFQAVGNCQSVVFLDAALTPDALETCGAFCILPIPDGATTAVVEIIYNSNGPFLVSGTEGSPLGGAHLEAAELAASVIAAGAYPDSYGILIPL